MQEGAACDNVLPRNENGLARLCVFETVSVDGGGHAFVRDHWDPHGDRLSYGNEADHRRGCAPASPREIVAACFARCWRVSAPTRVQRAADYSQQHVRATRHLRSAE